jgi:thiol:disulfide interchange protein DsbA
MKRRDFSLQVALGGVSAVGAMGAMGTVAGVGALLPQPALAQGNPVEGTHYTKLAQPAPVAAPPGKIEVVEFFSYGCPHCYSFEPALEGWSKQLPADVVLRRVPVGFNAAFETYQKIYYSLEAMGQVNAMHRKVFDAIHVHRQRLDKEADIVAFMQANGIDGAKFAEHFKSFSVQAKQRQAKQLSESYRIDGVPTLGVQGLYVTSGSLAGSNERALAVADKLVQGVRKPG